MSRRKQEKPQQRIVLETGEEGEIMYDSLKATDVGAMDSGNDVLICGECQTEFPLDDIVRFIRHKVHRCNKENIPCRTDQEDDDDNTDEDEVTVISANKRPSISAPIGLKNEPRLQSLPMNLSLESEEKICSKRARLNESEDLVIETRTLQVDAESNTVNSEPYSFLCGTCKSRYDSAWSLVQHAQNAHGLKIYVDMNANTHTNNNNNTISHNKNEPHVPEPKSFPTSPIISPLMNGLPHRMHRPGSREGPRSRAPSRESESAAAIITSSLTNGLTPANHPSSRGSSTHSSPIKPTDLPHHPPLINMPEMGHQHHNPFLFRMPIGADRQPLSPMNHGPFARPPGPMDFLHDPFHRMIGMPPRMDGPPPGMFPNHMLDRPRPGPPGPPGPSNIQPEQPMDFYSQRLRRLAGTTAIGQPEPVSPNKRTPPFSSAPFSPVTSTTNTTTAAPDIARELLSPSRGEPKQKACEFCGKSFRFQSNLIVHRRSHTGEKPFRCSLCPHACTQASKLKRHMKTHINRSPFGVGSLYTMVDGHNSRSNSPDSTGMNCNEDESSEEEMEEEEEEMDLSEVEPRDYRERNEPTDLSSRKSGSEDDENSEDLALGDRQALLAEVMEKSGLGDIQAYNEAFKQAVAENNNRTNGKDTRPVENGFPFRDGRKTPSEKEMKIRPDGPELPPYRPFQHHPHPLLRHHPDGRIKMEPNEQHLASMDALYSSIWFPPTANPRDIFMGQIRGPMDHGAPHPLLGRPHQNGGPPHSAFLESLHHHPPPGLGRPPGLIHPAGHPTRPHVHPDKKTNRSDMCEFCGKIFKNCSNLTVHRRSHTGEKPYRCELCSYACAQSSKLTRHMRTHCRDGKDVYRCKFCNMPFSVPSTLEKHMRKCVENHNMKMDASSISSSPLSMTDTSIGLDMSMAKPSPTQSV